MEKASRGIKLHPIMPKNGETIKIQGQIKWLLEEFA